MKVFVFLIALALFVSSFFLFGYAFTVEAPWHAIMFGGGIAAVCLAFAIPFHLLERAD